MISVVENTLSRDDWNTTAASFLDFSLIQIWEYGEVKRELGPWRVERLLFREDEDVIGLCQCMTRNVPFMNSGLVWVNRGPLWRKNPGEDKLRLLEMLQALRNYWVQGRGMYLLIAPPMYKEEISSDGFRDYGFAPAHRPEEWASARLDLDRSLEELRGNLDQKWRNCLGKAERSGLQCQSGTEEPIVTHILGEYAEMLHKKRLNGPAAPDLLAGLQTRFGDGNKLRGFIAVKENEKLGGILIARYGFTCEYLVSAVSDKGKSLNAGNYLLWQAISLMKGLGYRWFDLGGMHPIKTPAGIFHFKKGLGGQVYSLIGNIEAYRLGMLNRMINWRLSRSTNGA